MICFKQSVESSSGTSLLEEERNRYYLVLVSRETGFPGEFVRTRQVIAEGRRIPLLNQRRKPEDDTAQYTVDPADILGVHGAKANTVAQPHLTACRKTPARATFVATRQWPMCWTTLWYFDLGTTRTFIWSWSQEAGAAHCSITELSACGIKDSYGLVISDGACEVHEKCRDVQLCVLSDGTGFTSKQHLADAYDVGKSYGEGKRDGFNYGQVFEISQLGCAAR